MIGRRSGDLCRFVTHPGGKDYPAVEHYRCNDHRDGTVTDPATGRILTRAPIGAKRGFKREASA